MEEKIDNKIDELNDYLEKLIKEQRDLRERGQYIDAEILKATGALHVLMQIKK